MRNKNILIISPEKWNWQYVSKHHYAIELVKRGNRVFFLDPPNNDLNDIKIEKTQFENLYNIQAPVVKKGIRFYPKFLRVLFYKNWLKKLETRINKRIDIIWLFENSRFYDLKFAESRLKIYHQVDLNQDFHIKEAASSADICFCTTDFIREKIKKHNEKVFKIHHGYSPKKVDNNLDKTFLENIDNYFKNKINAVYIGNMEIKYLDKYLLMSIVDKFPNIMFHFVGNFSDENELYLHTKNRDNVKWWGMVKNKYIDYFLSKADVCLLTYKSEEFKEQLASPHKVMEYLASGKVIVATYTDEYKDKPELLEMVEHPREYVKKFDEVINNLDIYNSEEKKRARIKFATEHTYEKQVEKIIKKLEENGLKI